MSDYYIYPSEAALLVAILFGPPLLIGMSIQSWYLFRKNIEKPKVLKSLIITAVVSTPLGILMLCLAALLNLPSAFAVRDFEIGHYNVPVLLLAYIAVALVAPLVSWITKKRHGSA